MCDCMLLSYSLVFVRVHKTVFTRLHCCQSTLQDVIRNSGGARVRNGRFQHFSNCFRSDGFNMTTKRLLYNSIKASRDWGPDELELYEELGFKKKIENKIELETGSNGEEELSNLNYGPNFIEFDDGGKDGRENTTVGSNVNTKDEGLSKLKMKGVSDDFVGLKLEELEGGGSRSSNVFMSSRRRRHVMNRSNMIAKQVISIRSALSLGFVSQLWVDTNSWEVLVIEVRPNLLFGEFERFLLEDINKVGDVVLIQDECVLGSDIKMVGLETLVGYNVVTPGQQNIGKVRGYAFNINSGAVESLELDSFGISVIPSSLVSTYALFVEDVLEVASDTVVVHEAAASRIQRLTKGFWDAQKEEADEFAEYADLENHVRSDYDQRRQRSSTSQNFLSKLGEIADDWELPMDYL